MILLTAYKMAEIIVLIDDALLCLIFINDNPSIVNVLTFDI